LAPKTCTKFSPEDCDDANSGFRLTHTPRRITMKRILFTLLMLLLFASFLSFNPVNFYNLSHGASAAAKMDVDEVVRKHLEAIGATESRASSNSRIILGD